MKAPDPYVPHINFFIAHFKPQAFSTRSIIAATSCRNARCRILNHMGLRNVFLILGKSAIKRAKQTENLSHI